MTDRRLFLYMFCGLLSAVIAIASVIFGPLWLFIAALLTCALVAALLLAG